ncbi:MAG: hypothetical protein ACR2QA_06015 [Solirubrobacteraceae bacterium]
MTSARAQAFSPDLRFLTVVLASTNPGSDAASGLAVIDVRSGASRILACGSIYGASFAPDGPDRIVYGSAPTTALTARVDLHVVGAHGTGSAQITHDGASLNPVWGSAAVVFDHQRLRTLGAPLYQLWRMAPDLGGGGRPLTHLGVPPLLDGLVPLGFSQDGARLLAEYEGQDTSQAWTVSLATGRARELQVDAHSVTGGAISRDGRRVLVDVGGFLNAADAGRVESLPFTGGRARVLVAHGGQPSWSF